MSMSQTNRLLLVFSIVAGLALAFSAVTVTSRLTSAQGTDTTPAVQSCDDQDDADDAAEADTEEADTDDIEEECGPQDEADDAAEAEDTDDVQEPALNGSIAVDEAQTEGLTEKDEAAALAPLATISEAEAVAAAQSAVPGDVDEVELGNENGSLVYEVKIGGQEVKVDAGDGAVLQVEADD